MDAVERQRGEDAVVREEDGGRLRHGRRRGLSLITLFILAALVRLPFLFLAPVFSDDIFRHQWDGRVVARGIDPYAHSPASLAGRVPGLGSPDRVNHPEVPTVYGPLAQALAGLLALSPFHASLFSIKALVAAFDLLTIASLYSLGGAWPALAWAVHPLVVIEGAGEGHLDGVAVALLMASMALLARARGRLAAVLFAAAALVKLTPLGGAPAALRAFGRKGALLFLLVFAAAHLPFVGSGGPWRGFSVYAVSWEANGFVYPEVLTLVKKGGLAEGGKEAYGFVKALLGHPRVFDRGWGLFYPAFLARVILFVLFAVALYFIVTRVLDPIRATGLCLVALLAASPTLHPWYLLEVLPFALLFEWAPVLWVAGAAPLVYLTFLPRGQPAFPHPVLVRAAEFVPALLLLLFFRTPSRSDA